MDSRKAEGMRFTMNLVTPDNGEKFIVELENATLTNIEGFQAEKPDLTLTINRADLEQTMMGAKTLEAQIADGTAKVEGDAGILAQLAVDDGRLRSALRDHARHEGPAMAVAHADPYAGGAAADDRRIAGCVQARSRASSKVHRSDGSSMCHVRV